MANTIYWTPSIEKLQQANNTSGTISEASAWHGKIRLMGKCYSRAFWGSPSQKTEIQSSRLVSWDRLVFIAENTDQGVLAQLQISEGSWGQSAFQEFVTCPLHCGTNTKWKFISHLSVSFVILSFCPRDRWQLASAPCWYSFQHLFLYASANIGYLPCGSLMCGSVSWLNFGLLFLMHLSCWLIIYQIFISMMKSANVFYRNFGSQSVFFFLGFACCAVLCCRRHKREKCDSSAVPVWKICAYSVNES